MKNLPLLSKNFKKFNWETQFLNASDEQLQKAYQALSLKGYTSDFSYIVWNDMVELLILAMEEANLSWDNKYGNLNSLKMTDEDKILTENRFNSFIYNMEVLLNWNWRWSWDTSKEGFLGRSQVKGAKNYGLKADIIYGWYLLELVRAINVFIDILKNDANFGELINEEKEIKTNEFASLKDAKIKKLLYNNSIETVDNVSLIANIIGNLIVEKEITSTSDVCLLANEIRKLIGEKNIRTNSSTDLKALDKEKLGINNSSSTEAYSILERLLAKFLQNSEESNTNDFVKINKLPSKVLKKEEYIQTFAFAAMESYIGVILFINYASKTVDNVNLKNLEPSNLKTSSYSETINNSDLKNLKIELLKYNNYSQSMDIGNIMALKNIRIESYKNNSYSYNDVTLKSRKPEQFYSGGKSSIFTFSEIKNPEPIIINDNENISNTNEEAVLKSCFPKIMNSSNKSFTLENALIVKRLPNLLNANSNIYFKNESILIQRDPKQINILNNSYFQNNSLLLNRKPEYITTKDNSYFQNNSLLLNRKPEYIITKDNSYSCSNSEIAKAKAEFINSENSQINSYYSTELKRISSKNISSINNEIKTSQKELFIEVKQSKNIGLLENISYTNYYAALDWKYKDRDWIDPIYTEETGDLYIRQAWGIIPDNNNIDLN